MRTKVIDASDIHEAGGRILDELENGDAGNVIYFDGWDGLGASAVLQRVAGLLTPVAKAEELIFHIDCSKWESRRAMQRMIAKQLKLPPSMMEMFNTQDEEEDFQGVAKGSRAEIPQIAKAINQHIQQQYLWFLLIFHNGSSEEINLKSLGFPPFDQYSRGKVLWSFQGRFRAYPRMKVDGALKNTSTTDVFLSANSNLIKEDKLSDILHHEAEEVAHEMMNADGIDWPAAAANCFLYMVKLCRMGSELATDYDDLATHVCNYWRCDGIIELQQGDVCTDDGVDKLWLSYDAMQREMRLDVDKFHNPYFPSPLERCFHKDMAYWTSPTYGFMLIPDPHGQIPDCMFQRFDELCVLKLSSCMFSFTSPPFLCCHNLRFLWLDHCRDGSSAAEAVKEEEIGRFLQRLWVLDVRYSNKAFLSRKMMDFMTQLRELNMMGEDEDEWLDTDMLQGRMNNIRKLRITQSDVLRGENTFSGRDKLEFLEFSGNNFSDWFSVGISCGSLETVVISGPTSLNKISLTGCAKLKNIFLSGSFPDLLNIEITGAAVETLDLSTVTARNLDRLLLRACGNLCSILWSPATEGKRKRYIDKLHIDTSTQKEETATAAPGREFDWHISVRDARILRSLEPVKDYFGRNDAHVEISSPTRLCGDATGSSKDNRIMSSSEQLIKDNATKYADVARILKAHGGVCSHALSPTIMRTCPRPPDLPPKGCYMHIEDPVRRNKSQTASITLPVFICDAAKILHVHDSLHITSIVSASSAWNQLEWCRVEGCPNLECVFNPQLIEGPEGNDTDRNMFRKLRTTWASHLPNARYIWKCSGRSWWKYTFLREMTLLHLDCCPRLISIIHVPAFRRGLNNLESLEIMWCGDLSMAFILGYWKYWTLPKLKHIRLHELPKLQNIVYTVPWIRMPELETIKIRGCWSLRELPVVDDPTKEFRSNKVVECDCEKEWWDRLEWKSEEHRAQYKPTHPRHYKKTMIRGSVLR